MQKKGKGRKDCQNIAQKLCVHTVNGQTNKRLNYQSQMTNSLIFTNACMTSSRKTKNMLHVVKNKAQVYYWDQKKVRKERGCKKCCQVFDRKTKKFENESVKRHFLVSWLVNLDITSVYHLLPKDLLKK